MRHVRPLLLCLSVAIATSCTEPVAPEPGVPTALQVVSGDDQVGSPGAALDAAVVVRLQDGRGSPLAGVAVRFMAATGAGVIEPGVAVTGDDGIVRANWVLGDLVNTDLRALASVQRPGAAPLEVSFSAVALPNGPVAIVSSLVPAVLSPGATLTVLGDSLHYVSAATVAGVPAIISAQSPTTLQIEVPASGYECRPTDAVPVVLAAPGGRVQQLHPLRVAPQRELAVGQVLTSSAADPLACVEIPAGGGRYLIVVSNVATDTSARAGVRLRGLAASGGTATLIASPPSSARPASVSPTTAAPSRAAPHMIARPRDPRHHALPDAGLAATARVTAEANHIGEGDTLVIRVPRLPSTQGVCTGYDPVTARVAHVGQRAVILEDITNPIVGQLDADYQNLAAEYDDVVFPILRTHFGDPPGTDEPLLMVFTRRVNGYGIGGFVWSDDLGPRSDCAQSNEAPVFYGYVPTDPSEEYGEGTVGEWRWSIRSTIVHEAKHLTGFAARIDAGLPPQETWLEEASAMVAEELWARTVFGYDQLANVGFDGSVGCEIDGAFDREPCADRPGAMLAHFAFLAEWLTQPSTSSVLGPVTAADQSFYGSSWLFLRWLLDRASEPEAELLTRLTTSPLTGADAINAIFGRPFDQTYPEWAAAVALDDRSAFNPTPRHTLPSWDIRDIYSGLNREQPNLFPMAFPLRVRSLAYGNSQTDVPLVRPGGTAYFELSGQPAGRQALAFSGAGGTALPTDLRIVIVRVE